MCQRKDSKNGEPGGENTRAVGKFSELDANSVCSQTQEESQSF